MNKQVRAFFEQVAQEESLQAKLAGCSGAGREKAFKTIVEVAAEAGYSLTVADLDAAAEAAAAEMTPEQLEQVAAGGVGVWKSMDMASPDLAQYLLQASSGASQHNESTMGHN